MSKTVISWTDETANPLTGCTEEGPECVNCYARVASASPRLQQFEKYHGVVDDRGRWTGQINFSPEVLEKLLHLKKPRRVFMPSMSDPFHPGVKDEWLDQIFAAIALTPHITYQMLTKRPERMLEYLGRHEFIHEMKLAVFNMNFCGMKNYPELDVSKGFLKNLWPGVTTGTQKAADERIPLLLKTLAAVRFLSVEPMLENIDLTRCRVCNGSGASWNSIAQDYLGCPNCLADGFTDELCKIDWVIIGGESGSNARPFNLEWARSLIDQCREAGVKVFMKQAGSNAFYEGESFKTKSRAGSDIAEWPEWAQIQEFPCEVK
jgi:protein gp37